MSTSQAPRGQALLIDLDGVIYEDQEPIPGAAEAIGWLEEQRVPHLFLTNTTSKPRSALVRKMVRFGIGAEASRIVTPPFAANRWLAEHIDGRVALFVAEGVIEEFAGLDLAPPGDSGPVAAVVIGDYGDRWTFAELNRAFRLLMTEPRPRLIALGMTRYWHAGDGMRLDVAPFVVALEHASGIEPMVLGKPAEPFFEMALTTLGSTAAATWMIGDDVRSDIGGAQRAGIRGILVRTGKFRPADLELDIRPEAVLDSIAGLPGWWKTLA